MIPSPSQLQPVALPRAAPPVPDGWQQQPADPAVVGGNVLSWRNCSAIPTGGNPHEILYFANFIVGLVIWTKPCDVTNKQMQGIVVAGMSIGLDPIKTILVNENMIICSLFAFILY